MWIIDYENSQLALDILKPWDENILNIIHMSKVTILMCSEKIVPIH